MFRLSNGGAVGVKPGNSGNSVEARGGAQRRVRADAQRNMDALLKAAMAVFLDISGNKWDLIGPATKS